MQTEKNNKDSQEGILGFIQRNRKGILIFGAVLFVFVLFLAGYVFVSDSINKKALAGSEELAERFNDLRWFFNDENYNDEVDAFLKDLIEFAKNNKGLAGARVYSFIARIYSAREEWVLCEEAWRSASRIGDKTYIAPIALFNTAVSLEEQGKAEQAIEYFQKCLDHPFEFPAAPRAQFNIGRLYESLGNKQAALEAYRTVLINWQFMPEWQNLARTAIIRLEIGNID